MNDIADFEYIPGRFGYRLERAGPVEVTGWIDPMPSTRAADGTLGTAALLMAADMTCTMAAGLGVLPRWTVTADADLWIVDDCRVGPLRAEAVCLRAGRTMSVSSARLVDEGDGDRLVALATANNGVLTPRFEHFMARSEIGDVKVFARPEFPEDETLEAYFGLREANGEIVAPLGPRTTNPWGIFHGGLHGLLVEHAARAGGITAPRQLGLRFLNPVREGSAVARAVEVFDRDEDRVAKVEVRDTGNDRVAVVAHVAGPGPGHDGDTAL